MLDKKVTQPYQKNLLDEMKGQIYLFGQTFEYLQRKDQDRALEWLDMLISVPDSDERARLRNDCLHYLVKNCINGELGQPFHETPTPEILSSLPDLLPKRTYSCYRCGKIKSRRRSEKSKPKQDKPEKKRY